MNGFRYAKNEKIVLSTFVCEIFNRTTILRPVSALLEPSSANGVRYAEANGVRYANCHGRYAQT